MGERFGDYFLTLFAQVGGGRGGLENDLVRFGLGIVLWSVVLGFAVRRGREEQFPHERLLIWGFGVGLAREALMFVVVSLQVSGFVPRAVLLPWYPPLEHALAMAGVCTVTAGFLRVELGRHRGSRRFLVTGVVAAAALLLATAVPWYQRAQAEPGILFGATGYDVAFRLAAAAMLGWALLLLYVYGGRVRRVLLAAIGCFLADEVLMLANLAAGDAGREVLGPVRHVLHLAGIALLAYLYLRELAGERDEALTDLQTVINLTDDERRRTEAILDAIGDAVSVQDRAFRVLYQNRVHRALHGHHAGALCHEAYAGSAAPCPGCPLALSFADGAVHLLERPRARADGRVGVVEVATSCLRDAAGSVVAGIEVTRDITARAAAAAELRVAKADLERQNAELRTLDTMKDGLIRDVTHEFKTPVAKHAMQLELLRGIVREHGLERETERVLDVMEASIRRQQRMIHNILDLARLEAGGRRYRIAPVRLDEVIAEVLEDRAYALEGHRVAVSCALPPLALDSDREMLHCLFSNLVDNAVKYRAAGRAPRIDIAAAREAGQVVVRVADNGTGLSPEQLDRAFDRFWQATAAAEGSGVGLTICRMIAEDLGGAIAIASDGRDRGAVVTVRLPGDGPPAAAHRPGGAEPSRHPSHAPRPAHGLRAARDADA